MTQDDYKRLYYRAFNRITDLIEHAQAVQRELEELYLQLEDNAGQDG